MAKKLTNAQINLLLRLKKKEYIRCIHNGIWTGDAYRAVNKQTVDVLLRNRLARTETDFPRTILHITNAGLAALELWEKSIDEQIVRGE